MTKDRQIELMISLHKKVNVNALSDDGWREYQQERREMENALRKDRESSI
jgi:IS1 family transposase